MSGAGIGATTHMLNSRLHAGVRAATLSPKSFIQTVALVASGIFVLAFIALWLGGHLSTVSQSVQDYKRDRLMAIGFTVERIDVMGEGRLSEADVRAAVGIYKGDYFFGADLERAQARTESLPWVDRAVVRRLWPDRIVVQLVETTPYAIFQQDKAFYLVDDSGRTIATLTDETSRLPDDLRIFTGVEAAAHARQITQSLQSIPDLWRRTESLTRHASGRWDIRLDNQTLLRLPLGDETGAARRFVSLMQRLPDDSPYSVIDMRLPDRLTLTPVGTEQA